MRLRLPLWGDKFATIASVYALPTASPDAASNKFYEDIPASVPKANEFIVLEDLLIFAKTVIRLRMREKATWMHPRLRHWHLLDYVLVRRRNQRMCWGQSRSRVPAGRPTIASTSPSCGFAYSLTGNLKGMERSVKVRVRPCHLPAPSIVSNLLDSVCTLGPVEEERVRKTLRKPPCLLNLAMEHTVDVIGDDGRNIT
nr:unnamed protein product [Spirometra erinaceieuropaei]